ncbi:MAG: FAD-binding oxidoreductase [Pseudanabaena sp. Salubria-1]|nr:FAD-binding oxidoreductase [Pseudanabaena sp. Salubria-1]
MAEFSKRKIAIVGGGIFGAAIAYVLTRDGFDVTLFEALSIGAHASSKNAGNLNPLHGTPSALLPFALESFRLHQAIAIGLAELKSAHYNLLPSHRILLELDNSKRKSLKKSTDLFTNTEGFSAEELDVEALHQIEPRLSQNVRFGILTKGSLAVDSYLLTMSLAQGAERLGAKYVYDSVLGVTKKGDLITGVKTYQERFACDEIIFATGPWLGETQACLDIDIDIEPVKGELLLMQLSGKPLEYDFTWGSSCLYKRRKNQVWVGGIFERSSFDMSPSLKNRESMLNQAAQIIPEIREARLLEHVVGLRPMTSSGLPLVGRVHKWQNAYLANGGGSKGVLLSVGIAQVIRDLLMEGKTNLSVESFLLGQEGRMALSSDHHYANSSLFLI